MCVVEEWSALVNGFAIASSQETSEILALSRRHTHTATHTHARTHTPPPPSLGAGHASRIPPKNSHFTAIPLRPRTAPQFKSSHTHTLRCQTHREAVVCEDGSCVFALRVCMCRKIRGEARRADRTAAQGGVTDLQRGGRPAGEPVRFGFTLLFSVRSA